MAQQNPNRAKIAGGLVGDAGFESDVGHPLIDQAPFHSSTGHRQDGLPDLRLSEPSDLGEIDVRQVG